jgi:hypothetical protein
MLVNVSSMNRQYRIGRSLESPGEFASIPGNATGNSRGWFETDEQMAPHALGCHTISIRAKVRNVEPPVNQCAMSSVPEVSI